MKTSTGQVCCIVVLAGVAALYHNREAKREEHAWNCESGAVSSTETSASNNVMSNPYLVQSILDFVGPGQHLYISTISKLVRQCYGNVQAIECPVHCLKTGKLTGKVVSSQMTQYSQMCTSRSRLMLAVECGVQFTPQRSTPLRRAAHVLLAACSSSSYKNRLATAAVDDPLKMEKLLLGEHADKALLAFAYGNLGIPFYSPYVTIGAIMSGDLEKLQWLASRAAMCAESSAIAARYGHTNILKWLCEIKFPIIEGTCGEAAFYGHLGVLQLLYTKNHKWHEKCGLVAAAGGHLAVVQWLSEHGCAYDITAMTLQAAHYGHKQLLDWLLTQAGAQLSVDVMEAAAAGGQLLMCQHLRSLGCAWDTSVCSVAALKGQHDVLRHLREHGCPTSDGICISAGKGGSVQVIQYLVEQGVVHEREDMMCVLLLAGAHGHLAAAQWLIQQGVEWPLKLYYSVTEDTLLQ
jgi:hypothetical protein